MSLPRPVIDYAALADLWAAGTPTAEIAARFGVGANAVTKAARRRGLPARHLKAKAPRPAAPKPEAPRRAAKPEARKPVPVPPPHPFWTPERDAALHAGGGSHAALSALAARLGRPIADVQKRWHRVRA